MSKHSKSSLDVTLGQIEDELRQIQSAREQVNSVVATGSELSSSCDRLVGSLTTLMEDSSVRMKDATDALTKEAGRLSEHSTTIERMTDESAEAVEAIRKQSTEAQAQLEQATSRSVERASSEISGVASQAIAAFNEGIDTANDNLSTSREALDRAASDVNDASTALQKLGSETADAVRKQAADAQSAMEKAIGAAVESTSSEISGFARQAIDDIQASLSETTEGIDSAVESLNAAAADAEKERDALLEAQSGFTDEMTRQSAETKALLQQAQELLTEIDAKIATLKEFDIEGLASNLDDLRKIESDNASSLAKQISVLTIMVGVVIIACLAILARMFMA